MSGLSRPRDRRGTAQVSEPRGSSNEQHVGMDAEGRVDLGTAQRMVQQAVVQATRHEDKAAAIVQVKTAATARKIARTNALLGVGVVLALLAVGVAAVMTYRARKAAQVLATEAGLGAKPAARPSGTIPSQVLQGRIIFEQNKAAVYVMGYLFGDSIGGCCSAFAIAPDLLATNAHCVLSCGRPGSTPIVTQNESGGKTRFKIIGKNNHPGYLAKSKNADSPDVGLLRIAGKMPAVVTLANEAELRAIGPGDDAYVIGFPGRVMDPINPSATFLQGRIGRVTGLSEEATTPDRSVLIQHDAVTRGGNSGSPIFNQYGHVIGIHAAHIDDEDEVTIGGNKTKVVASSPFRLGMRIDLIKGVPAP